MYVVDEVVRMGPHRITVARGRGTAGIITRRPIRSALGPPSRSR